MLFCQTVFILMIPASAVPHTPSLSCQGGRGGSWGHPTTGHAVGAGWAEPEIGDRLQWHPQNVWDKPDCGPAQGPARSTD